MDRIAFVVMFLCGVVFIYLIVDEEVRYNNIEPVPVSAVLLTSSYNESTLQTDVVPVVTGNSVGFGIASSGSGEKFITIWLINGVRVVCTNKNVWSKALEAGKTYTALVKIRFGEYRIYDIY